MALAELVDERAQVGQVVRVVGVGHDDVLAVGGVDAGEQGTAVAADRRVHDPGAVVLRDALRPVGRTVVADQHLTRDTQVGEGLAGLLHADGQRLGLVQARQDDRDLDRIGRL